MLLRGGIRLGARRRRELMEHSKQRARACEYNPQYAHHNHPPTHTHSLTRNSLTNTQLTHLVGKGGEGGGNRRDARHQRRHRERHRQQHCRHADGQLRVREGQGRERVWTGTGGGEPRHHRVIANERMLGEDRARVRMSTYVQADSAPEGLPRDRF